MTVVHGSRPPVPALVRTEPGALEHLVAAAAEAELDAVNTLKHVMEPVAIRYCRARLDRRAHVSGADLSPDDVAHEICVAVLHALPRHADRGGSFLSLVYSVAAARVDEVLRMTSGRPGGSAQVRGPVAMSEHERLTDAIATLPPDQRELLILRIVVGFDAEDTAAALTSTPAAVRVRQHHALDRLRDVLHPSPAGPARRPASGR
jgi:RNA polymerase sigma-70 factor (ECF subfamily)